MMLIVCWWKVLNNGIMSIIITCAQRDCCCHNCTTQSCCLLELRHKFYIHTCRKRGAGRLATSSTLMMPFEISILIKEGFLWIHNFQAKIRGTWKWHILWMGVLYFQKICCFFSSFIRIVYRQLNAAGNLAEKLQGV